MNSLFFAAHLFIIGEIPWFKWVGVIIFCK